ncbi:MAG: TetR/AcrR family transcriptional regulator [Calditrichaeota bacterium]|nr:MAG: TetR/AcrR family transcriptional regulator [Calditrichota bacterium]
MQKASLYYYYKNKEDIFRDVIEHETRDFFKTLEQKLSGMDSAVDKIYAFARIRLEFFHQFINLNNLSIDVILEVKPLVDRLYREFRLKQVAYLRDILKQGIATREIRKCQPPKVANAIFTILEAIAINELQRAEVQDARDIDYKKLEKETNYVLTLLINGLKP